MLDYFSQGMMQVEKKNEKKGKKANEDDQTTLTSINRILYIGELPPDVDQYELYQLILSKGNFDIESLTVKQTRDNKSYAYVKFKSRNEAEKAKKALHLLNLRHFIIQVENFDINNKEHHAENQNFSPCNLFVKNLATETTSEDFYNLLYPYGEIKSIKLKQDEKGRCIGYGYVQFASEENAKSAIAGLNESTFKGRNIKVDNFHDIKQRHMGKNNFSMLLIKRVPDSLTNENELESFFSIYGKVVFVHVVQSDKLIDDLHLNNWIGKCKGFTGVVVYEKKESAEQALNLLNGKVIDKSNVQLEMTMDIDNDLLDKVWKAKQEHYKEKYENCNLIVKNLPKEVGNKELYEMFRKIGEVSSAKIAIKGVFREKIINNQIVDKEFVYESKGYGFVCFKKPENAMKAIENLNNSAVMGKGQEYRITVEFFNYDRVASKTKTPHKIEYQNHNHNPQLKRNGHLQQYNNIIYNPTFYPKVSPLHLIQQPQFDFRNENLKLNQNSTLFSNFVIELQQVIKSHENIDKKESIGEKVFFFLIQFIPSVNTIDSSGMSPEELSSRLTGIFINADKETLLEVFQSEKNLINTMNDLIKNIKVNT